MGNLCQPAGPPTIIFVDLQAKTQNRRRRPPPAYRAAPATLQPSMSDYIKAVCHSAEESMVKISHDV
jgi:hypothetical protein